jgi:hypothetical protein
MNLISRDDLKQRMEVARIKSRIRRNIRFVPEEISRWEDRDYLAVMDKPRHDGVLLYGDDAVPFSLSARQPNANGRVEAIICDICATWRRGTESASITFQKNATSTVSYLVCADLDCSLHVRSLTDAARLSRTQLREDITPEARIERLNKKLQSILASLF